MTARAEILGRLARNLRGGKPVDTLMASTLNNRVKYPLQGPIPKRTHGLDRAGLTGLFADQLRGVDATVARVSTLGELPAAIAEYLAAQNLPAEIAITPDPVLKATPWTSRPLLQVKSGAPSPTDPVGVSVGFAGLAETGTLMLRSGPDNPSTMNFLPDTHVVVVPASRVVGPIETAFERLRDDGALPRTVNFITGPSRTADIAQKLEMGAHGPRRLHVVIVDDETLA